MRYLGIVFVLCFNVLNGQNNQINVKSQLSEVTVYQQGALLERTGSVDLPKSELELVFDELDPSIQHASLRFTCKGDVTIIHQSAILHTDTLDKGAENFNETALKDRQNQINLEKERLNKQIQVYQKEEGFINDNLRLGSTEEAVKLEDVIRASSFLRERYIEIQNLKSSIEDKIRTLDSEYYTIQNKLTQHKQVRTIQHLQYVVRLRSNKIQKAELSLQYYIPSAGWSASYEVRANGETDSLELIKFANVFQSGREAWNNVSLNITNSNPAMNQTLPEIDREILRRKESYSNISYGSGTIHNQAYSVAAYNPQIRQISGVVRDENGEALPFVNVTLPECAVGVTTDFNGGFSLSIPEKCRSIRFDYIGFKSLVFNISTNYMTVIMGGPSMELSEVVITNFKADKPGRYKNMAIEDESVYNAVAIQYTPTQVKFSPSGKYSISNKGESFAIMLEQSFVKAEFIRESVPYVDPAVYITARIPDWQQYNLMPGQINIYQENMFLGTSMLNPVQANDTLSISMGIDQDIKVSFSTTKYRNEKKVLSSKMERERAYEIAIKNNKRYPVEIVVYDRVPLSYEDDIKIELDNPNEAVKDQESGKLHWTLNANPSEQINLRYGFTITHPSAYNLNFQR